MGINYTANLKRMRELLLLMKQEIENKKDNQKHERDHLVIPSEEVEIFKFRLASILNQNQLTVLDVEKITSMLLNLSRSTTYDSYVKEFQNLCHHKYPVSSDWEKAAKAVGKYGYLEIAKKEVYSTLKFISSNLTSCNPGEYIAVLLWIVREDGLYLPEEWNKYKTGIGEYNGLWNVPVETAPVTAEMISKWRKCRTRRN